MMEVNHRNINNGMFIDFISLNNTDMTLNLAEDTSEDIFFGIKNHRLIINQNTKKNDNIIK